MDQGVNRIVLPGNRSMEWILRDNGTRRTGVALIVVSSFNNLSAQQVDDSGSVAGTFEESEGAVRQVGLGKPKVVAVASGDVHNDSVLTCSRTPYHCLNVDEDSARRLSGVTEFLQSPVSVRVTSRPVARHRCRDG